MTTFRAETMLGTNRTPDARLEVKFADGDGREHVLSLPLMVAASLTAVFEQVRDDASRPTSPGQFFRALEKWSVGRTDHPPAVLLSLNDDPQHMLDGEDAMNLGRILREVGERVMAEGDGKPQ